MNRYVTFIVFFSALSISIIGCKDEEKNFICTCSPDSDAYFFSDSTVTEGIAIVNAFSPNGDGRNDRFNILGTGITSVTVIIKDGNTIVFQTNSTSGSWDGKVNGTAVDCQTFDYVVDATFTSGTTKHFEGTLTVYTGSGSCPDDIPNCLFESLYDGSGFTPLIHSGESFSGCQ